jgi:hypothetical protein
MLSKYNLKVGDIYDSSEIKTGEYSSSDIGYGLQSSEAIGYVSGQTRYGTVAFSGTNYWYDGSSLKSKYGLSYPADVYDTNYSDASGSNYSVVHYVENYKDILEEYGLTVQSARLLTYSEATTNVGCSGSSCPTGFIRNTSFWLGSAGEEHWEWNISVNGFFRSTDYNNVRIFGVRPVIVIAKSDVIGHYNNAEPEFSITIPSGRTRDNLQLGDEICINKYTSECFNFIRYDGDNVVMLSKWNLKVGNIYNSSATKIGEYLSSDSGYGLQSEESKGSVSGQTQYGTVAFSGINYWYDGSSLKSKYGSSYPADVYDTDYSDASGTNYSAAYYVKNYKDILETYGLAVQAARLLTYSEATTNIGCSGSLCPNGFIRNTTFWLGSAGQSNSVWYATSSGGFNYKGYYCGTAFLGGVRPVIVFSKTDI